MSDIGENTGQSVAGYKPGLFGALFDMSFKRFITLDILKILYLLLIIIIGIAVLALMVAGFSNGFGFGILTLIVAPIVGFIYIVLIRIWLELIAVIFRIADNTSTLVEQNRGG